MTWKRAALLPMLVALWACAEGGGRGSGISTDVLGNVATVQPAGSVSSASDLSGIAVSVTGTTAAAKTDDDGTFSLHGPFDGMVTIVFALPDDRGEARLDVNVPAGGTLTLNNVELDAQRGEAVAETADVDFTGAVETANCAVGTLIMTSSPTTRDDTDRYLVDLSTSSLQNAHGDPIPCSALQAGQRASVQGMVNRDGSFGEATIVVQN
jgi:hypothetical protein